MLQSLAALESENAELKTKGKVALVARASELMPAGKPAFTNVVAYPTISKLVAERGRASIMAAVFVMIKDFCSAVNVVRNMTEDQMIEAAGMLLDECGNFRLEDYVMMFTMAKRGQLPINDGKGLMDRVDVETVGKLLDAYWLKRDQAGKAAQEEEVKRVDNLLSDRNVTFAEPIAEVFTKWRREAQELDQAAQEAKDEEFRKRRDQSVLAFERLMSLTPFIEKLQAGQATSPEDLQFYENHKEIIEAELQRRASQNNNQ